jgi:HEAT repeat protein
VAVAGHRGDTTTARDHLADPDPGVRATALRALARLGVLRDEDLRSAASDPHPAVRRAAGALVARHDPHDAGATVLRLLHDEDPSVVEVAAWAAGERPPPEEAVLTRLCELARHHPDALVREAAVASLGAIGDERGLPAVLAATGDRPAVRRRAVLALAAFSGPDVDAALARALTDRDGQVRAAAEDLLA